jgi:hypothetical protein
MRAWLSFLFAILLWTFAPSARAQTSTPPSEAGNEAHTRWYGWQTMVADAATVAAEIAVDHTLIVLPGEQKHGPTTQNGGYVFAAGYLAASPVIHLLHGHPKKSLASLGLRLGAPLLLSVAGTIIGAMSSPNSHDAWAENIFTGFQVGVYAGITAAMLTDYIFLARDTVLEPPPAATGSLTVTASPNRTGGASIGLVASF